MSKDIESKKDSPKEVNKLVVVKKVRTVVKAPISPAADKPRSADKAPTPIAKNNPLVNQFKNGDAPPSVPYAAISIKTAATEQPKPVPPPSFVPLDMAMLNSSTETGDRRTETASSGFEYRTDTQSTEVVHEADTPNSSLDFHEEEDVDQPVTAVMMVETQSQEAGKRSPSPAAEVSREPPSPPARPPQQQSMKNDPESEKASASVITGSTDEAVTETTNRNGKVKQKLFSDADSSCSENVSTSSPKEVNNPSCSLLTLNAASPLAPPAEPTAPKETNATRLAMEYRVGDMAPVLVRGQKYVFDYHDMRWRTHDITVRLLHPNRGVGQDKYFAIFSAELLDPIKAAAPMFAKVYRRNVADVAEADYFSLGQAQALCEEFARDYARQKPRPGYPRYRLPLLTNRVVVRLNMKSIADPAMRRARKGFFSYRTEDTRQLLFFMEPNTIACAAVGASFTSPEVDNGKCYPQGDLAWPRQVYSDIADGLSHFSFVQSRGKMVMHGFLHSNGYLLDPLFHTTDREGFRMGDGGKKAIDEWVARHRCGDTCRSLGIRSLCEDTVDVSAAAVFNPLANTDNHYTDYLRSVRQMRVVVRIDLGAHDLSEERTEDDFDSFSQRSESLVSAVGAVHAVPVASASFPVTLNAVKYVFLPARARWEKVPMKMTVLSPNKPDMADERSAYFTIEEVHEGAPSIPMRAKFILRHDTKDADYYHVGDAYCVCVALGQVFRSYRKNGVFERELEFRSAYAVRVPQSEIPESLRAHMRCDSFFAHTTADSGDVMFILEPTFRSDAPPRPAGAGGMPKDAQGFDDRELRQVVDAFSHFTLHKSGNHLLVCELKCKDGLLTRPHIDTSNGRGFETINDGERGIRHWVKHHTCNPLCALLGMEPLPPRLKLYNISNNRLMKYINLVQQHTLQEDEKVDFNLPPRSPSEIGSRYASEQREASMENNASAEQACASNSTSTAVSPLKEDGGLLLRPWVHTGKGTIPKSPAKKNGVLDSGPRRPLTLADLNKLQRRGIDTKYILPATKYDYDINTLSWKVSRMFVRIVAPERGIGQGGMRVCFEVTDIDPEECEETVMVAKMYRRTIKDVVEKDYFTEVTVQKLSALFVRDFNAEKKEGCGEWLRVLGSAVVAIERPDLNPQLLAKRTGFFSYRTTDSQRVMFSIEPRLEGRFTKYNGNMGEAYPTNESRLTPAAARERTKVFEAVEALSHYSLVKSEGALLLCDIQGVKNELTDLEIHTYDGRGLGIGNFGARGIAKFVERHRCTPVCKALHLENLQDQKFDVTDEVKRNNKYVRVFERSREIDTMP
ncbi:elongation factor-2 kinase efk-1b isoform-like protein [Leptomonas pyrrhocoris]|uniref:Elongation factor-2 kinase efk-1b isoform-like protein n=1 Tax=Leptomonas pyrrhocoris TaxID=157538 RepID=A0A0M9G385_LEPPY|nr:elongation factor-2 kinase efk-1b isoform-like protein [Leptomonas pyrrhocoris]KPA81510.1 elongation factor-2 kinase efk-1b isoform-like protein [Leptomonas pyrrhocoris]|eukprot:XP_015659949.1 elongation factor-2 kinase efk-1b isoform-like protein [Leptomonas pyrrhocoris]